MMRHKLEICGNAKSPVICTVCGKSWRSEPRESSGCPGVRWYPWQTSPDYLRTYTQLRAMHLQPRDRREPDGCIVCKDEWVWLYDQRQAVARRHCSDLQRQALARARARLREKWKCEHCLYEPANPAQIRQHFAWPGLCLDCKKHIEHESRMYGDRLAAIEWAQAMLARQDWAVIDTETTSLDGVVVEVCAVAPDGTIIFESLVKPDRPVTPGARTVHGISDEELATAPDLAAIWPELLKALQGRTLLLAYNVEFDQAVLSRSARAAGVPELPQQWECLKLWYAQYAGDWSDYWHSYRWQPLPEAGHRAKGDALAALALLKRMAATNLDKDGEEGQPCSLSSP